MPEQYNNGLRNKFDWYRQATSANDLGLNSTTGRSSTSRRPSPKYKHPETVPSSVNEGVSRQRSRYDVPPTNNKSDSLIIPKAVEFNPGSWRSQSHSDPDDLCIPEPTEFNEGLWRPQVNHNDSTYSPGERTSSSKPKIEDGITDDTYIKPEFSPNDAFEMQLLKDMKEKSIQGTSTYVSASKVTERRRQSTNRTSRRNDDLSNRCTKSYDTIGSNRKESEDPAANRVSAPVNKAPKPSRASLAES